MVDGTHLVLVHGGRGGEVPEITMVYILVLVHGGRGGGNENAKDISLADYLKFYYRGACPLLTYIKKRCLYKHN